jgi:Tfp pilus assembly pilus retraction ATPase PilT
LRAALRMNPDAILLGEIRDADTAATALSAAATGHLVLTTVHAASVPQAIRRLVDIGSRQNSFAYTPDYVASCLTCCIHQRLDRQSETAPPKAEGLSNRRLNATTLFTNDAVRTMIRTSRFERLQDEIESQRVRYGWGPEPARRAV